jgi:hypothetical protein
LEKRCKLLRILRRCAGRCQGPSQWPWLIDNRAEFTLLTTESLVESIVEGAFHKIWERGHAGRRLITKFELDRVPPIYPVCNSTGEPLLIATTATASRRLPLSFCPKVTMG